MPNDGMWDQFTKLVPPERLNQPKPAPQPDYAGLEAEMLRLLNSEAARHCERTAALANALSRPVTQPPAPQSQFVATIQEMQAQVASLAAFDAVAAQLAGAGRPALGQRLQAIRDDGKKAIAICQKMGVDAGVNRAALAQAAAEATEYARTQTEKLTAAMKTSFDALNSLWQSTHKR